MTAGAVAKREPDGPRELVAAYAVDFAQVAPSHVRVDQWVRLAQGALKKGKKVAHPVTKKAVTELELAAGNNPGKFLAYLLDAARLGLEPGTEQYYLTPRREKGRLEILGIIGYQGYIELMYRAGAISSVVAELVYERDAFQFRPGVDERPQHDIDWDSADRGALRLAYAYAVMRDGATSKVVVLNRAAIDIIKKSSPGSGYDNSPWVTHPGSMWLKSAVRQLAKWVPTSAEYRRELARVERGDERGELADQMARGSFERPIDVSHLPEVRSDDFDPALTDGDEYVDAEIVADPAPRPAGTTPVDGAGAPVSVEVPAPSDPAAPPPAGGTGSDTTAQAPESPPAEPAPSPPARPGDRPAVAAQKKRIGVLATEAKLDDAGRLELVSVLAGREVTSTNELGMREAAVIVERLEEMAKGEDFPGAVDTLLREAEAVRMEAEIVAADGEPS
jgi:recombination protein RecT